MRTELLGVRKCKDKYPLETCISLNQSAKFLIERGLAREISKEEAKKLSRDFNKMGLVNVSENYSDGAHLLFCNCCSCCCNVLGGILRWDNPRSTAAANFVAFVSNHEDCEKCGTCVEKCIFNAISMNDDGPKFNKKKCMGCGSCVLNCPTSVIELRREEKEQICKDFVELGLKIGRETH
jgi:Pyruvate/2-oxoacid:ferredoxin oxidoreductase delta subunit